MQTPSADPELWQAIFNSLEQQNQCQERQLARHLSDASPELAGRLRQQRSEQRRVSAEGVTYFACTDGSGSDSSSQELSSAGGGLVLPSFAGHPPAVRAAVVGQLCNGYLQSQAEEVRGHPWGWPGLGTQQRRACTSCGKHRALECLPAPPPPTPTRP